MRQTYITGTELVGTLNDLLELDHDAVNAYGIAIRGIRNPDWKQDLIRFRSDHERHVENLGVLIRRYGGEPIEHSHVPTGAFKAAVQAAGGAGGDREVLLAFKANEGQVRSKYRREAAGDHPEDVEVVLRRNARDEERHYAWVCAALEQLGAGSRSAVGRAEKAFESLHGGAANVMEVAERKVRASQNKGLLLAGAALAILGARRILR
ncbi:MAG TPA: DUF2383 domain-containing protein [Longimicrobiales bacterium]|nr:DUF2383 domain-containing protein [Longimicrobiales bacterium]